MKISVIAKTPYYLVVDKPSGLPTVPLKTDGPDKETLLSLVRAQFPEVMGFGRHPWEGGVLHRLDTPTRGLVVVARDQNSYARLAKAQDEGLMVKDYLAVSSVHRAQLPVGFPAFPYGDVTGGDEVVVGSWFRPYGEKSRVVRPVDPSCPKAWKSKSTGVWYETRVKQISDAGGSHAFACEITGGFRHQIRCHLAWAGWPLDGDESYRGAKDKPFGLSCVALTFPDPVTGRTVRYTLEG